MPITSQSKRRELEEEIARLRDDLAKSKGDRDRYKGERDALRELRDYSQGIANGQGIRCKLAMRLQGEGIEIGALHNPLPMPSGAVAKYVDYMTREENLQRFKKLDPERMVETHYKCNGEKLEIIPDESQNFVVANHMLEHCIDPISTIETFLRVTKEGGHLYIALPDKRFTFDHRRPTTTFEHLLSDYEAKRTKEPLETYQDWCEFVKPKSDPQELYEQQADIHFHAWSLFEMVEMFYRMRTELGFPIRLDEVATRGIEVILLLTKSSDDREEEAYRDIHGAAAHFANSRKKR